MRLIVSLTNSAFLMSGLEALHQDDSLAECEIEFDMDRIPADVAIQIRLRVLENLYLCKGVDCGDGNVLPVSDEDGEPSLLILEGCGVYDLIKAIRADQQEAAAELAASIECQKLRRTFLVDPESDESFLAELERAKAKITPKIVCLPPPISAVVNELNRNANANNTMDEVCSSLYQQFLDHYCEVAREMKEFEEQREEKTPDTLEKLRQDVVESCSLAASVGMEFCTLFEECFSSEDDWRRCLKISRESFMAMVTQLMDAARVLEFNEEGGYTAPIPQLDLWPEGDEPVKGD
jgi:hypothetical protein